MTRIYWSNEEELAVFVRANNLLETGQETGFGRALVNAQIAVLPMDRRRPEKSLLTGVTAMRPRFDSVIAEHKRNIKNAAAVEQKKVEEHQQEIQKEKQIQLADAVIERAVVENALERIGIIDQASLDVGVEKFIQPDFLRNIINRISRNFEDSLVLELNAAAMRAHERVARTLEAQIQSFEELPKPRASRPKVLIIGFKSFFNAEFEREFGQFLDLSFLDATVNLKQVQRAAAMCDHVLLIKKFASHSHTEVLKNHPGYKLIVGAASVTKDVLTELSVKFDDANK